MTSHDPECRVDLGPAVALFRSLGDPTRLTLLHELARGERRVVDLTRAVGLAQSTVSAHLACLKDCGLVVSRPVGRQSMFSLARPELLDLLAAGEQLLAATGAQVALCPTYGVDRAPVDLRAPAVARPA
jgi:ArsR family transcriptional regulator, cadmium/lead-responsive transcriptional repressor